MWKIGNRESILWNKIFFWNDIGYFVNSNYLLESKGYGKQNMSLIMAKKGIYNPKKVLKNKG